MDSRHTHRIHIVQKLFPLGFSGLSQEVPQEDDQTVQDIVTNLKKIDSLIAEYAPRYPISKIAKMDLSILRLSLYELVIDRKEPPKVVIDEAVTLAKEFGNEKSYSFINGVLASALKKISTS